MRPDLSRRTIVVLAVLAAASAASAAAVSYFHNGRIAMNHSLTILLSERLHLDYRLEQHMLDAGAVDASGMWWVVLEEPSRNGLTRLGEPALMRSDAADLSYYRQLFQQHFVPVPTLDGYELLRGEIALGQGSICESLPCNVDILLSKDSPNMFVRISKT